MAEEYDLQPLLDVRQNQLSILFADSNSIDTKALAIIATDVAIMVFAAQDFHPHHLVISVIMFIVYVLAIILSLVSLWNWHYVGAGTNLDQHPEYLGLDYESLLIQLLSDTEYAINNNARLNRLRWLFVLTSFICTVFSTLLLFVII